MQWCARGTGNTYKLYKTLHFRSDDSFWKACRYFSSNTFASQTKNCSGRKILFRCSIKCARDKPSHVAILPVARYSSLHTNVRGRSKCRTLNYQPIRHSHLQDLERRRYLIWRFQMSAFAIGFLLAAVFMYSVLKRQFRKSRGYEDVVVPYLKKPKIIRYKQYLLPTLLEPVLPKLDEFKIRDDDIFVVSFPRSGLTLLQEIVYLVQTDDFVKAKEVKVDERFPYIEFSSLNKLENAPSPRFLRSHLALELLPKELEDSKAKVIYIARNAKDVIVSYYETVKLFNQVVKYRGNMADFCESFARNRVPYGPWPKHVLGFWERRTRDNFLFLKYEDLIKDPEASIREIARFLGKKLTDEQVKKIKEHCSFQNMKNNSAVNYNRFKKFGVSDKKAKEFIRKGEIGEWVGSLTEEDVKKLNFMLALYLKDTGLTFNYGFEKKGVKNYYGM